MLLENDLHIALLSCSSYVAYFHMSESSLPSIKTAVFSLTHKVTALSRKLGGSCAMSKCKHSFQNFSVCQTLDELDFERGIWSAAQQNDIAKVKQWISSKDVDAVDKYGYTALHYASRNGHLEICKLLISHGANVNALTESGKVSPLHRCVSIGHTDIFQLLVESGASVDIKDGDGKTVLHRAVEGGHFNLAEEILKLNPSLAKEIDKKGCTPKQYLNKSETSLDLFNKNLDT